MARPDLSGMVSDLRFRILLLLTLIFALVIPMNAHGATTTVTIKDSQFIPRDVSIRPGDTVTWVNKDPVQHNVDLSSDKSPLLSQGQAYSHAFGQPGVYDYNCDVHPFMKGRVTVG